MQLGFCTTLEHLPDTPTLFIPEDVLCRRHEELERIGRGAFGEVYKYTDHNTRCTVALKCLPIQENVLMEVFNFLSSTHSAWYAPPPYPNIWGDLQPLHPCNLHTMF